MHWNTFILYSSRVSFSSSYDLVHTLHTRIRFTVDSQCSRGHLGRFHVVRLAEFTQQWHLTGFIYSLSSLFIRKTPPSTFDESLSHLSESHTNTIFKRLIVQILCLEVLTLNKGRSSSKSFTFSQHLFLCCYTHTHKIHLLFLISISPPVGFLCRVAEANFCLLLYT